MDEKDYISIEKEYSNFKEKISNDIESPSISLENPDCYLIEESWYEELKTYFDKYHNYKNKKKNKKKKIQNDFLDLIPENDPQFINNFSSIIKCLNKDKKMILVSRKLIESIYEEDDLKYFNIDKYYSGNKK